MARRYKLLFIVGFVLLAATTTFTGWSLSQLSSSIELRKQTNALQVQLDDVMQSLLEADNIFMQMKIHGDAELTEALLAEIHRIKTTMGDLVKLPGQNDEIRAEVLALQLLILEKFRFLDEYELHPEMDFPTILRKSIQVNDNVLLTGVVRRAVEKIDEHLTANMIEHQGFVSRYFSLVLVTLMVASVLALLLLGSFGLLTTKEISRRARLERELRRAQDAALVASNLKSQFLATVSHEIRTPLNGIIGMSDVLRSRLDNPELKHFANIIRTSGQTLLRIVNDILDFSKIEAGKIEFEIQEFNLGELIESALELFNPKAKEKGLLLLGATDRSLGGRLASDSARVGQILHNLIGNAIKFTAEGHVYVSAKLIKQEEDHLRVRISVEDTGPGIPVERQGLLFQPFNQLDSPQQNEGTGLGLAISRQLAEKLGGTIGLKSSPQDGSTFWLEIPLRRTAPPPPLPLEIKKYRFLRLRDHGIGDRFAEEYVESIGSEIIWLDQAPKVGTAMGPTCLLVSEGSDDIQSQPPVEIIQIGRSLIADPSTRPIRQAIVFEQIDQFLAKASRPNVEAPEPLVARKPSPSGHPKGQILVVEDNSTNQILAQAQLEELGYQVHVVANGQECLEALKHLHYDLILMDCRMPIMDGYETTRRIRDRESLLSTVHIPIIAMTANAISGDRDKCLASGMDEYITKPLDLDHLQEVVQKFLQRKAAGINWSILRDLETKTNRQVIKRLVLSFISTLERLIPTIIEAQQKNDFKQLASLAHQLKSSAGALGASELSRQCQWVEDLERTGTAVPRDAIDAWIKTCRLTLAEMQSQRLYS